MSRNKMTSERLKKISGEVASGCLESACQAMMYAMMHYIDALDANRRVLQDIKERNEEDEQIKDRLHDLVWHEVQSVFYRLLWIYNERYSEELQIKRKA